MNHVIVYRSIPGRGNQEEGWRAEGDEQVFIYAIDKLRPAHANPLI